MDIKEFLKKKISFERIVEFPKTPVIIFEPMLNCYEKNDYAQKLEIDYAPTGIVLQNENYEGWLDLSTKIKITNLDLINRIITDVRSYNEEAKRSFSKIIKQVDSFNDKLSFKEAILQLNKITSNIYNRFVFFTDELFEIFDKDKIEELQNVRMELDDVVANYLWPAYEKLIKMLNEKWQIDLEVVENATCEEIIKILEGDVRVDVKAIADRPIAFVFLNGIKTIFTSEDALAIIKYLLAQDPDQKLIQKAKKSKIIIGQIGNSGIAKGRVVRFLVADYKNQKKIAELNQITDYILVSPMTQPELVSYMKKAVAFVTDEGGITCHAAIIAREMKKPCIIGTKIATQVLKDGMEVEVDADKGVVKIIK